MPKPYLLPTASLYAEALSIADRLCLTEIEDADKEADVFFPEVDEALSIADRLCLTEIEDADKEADVFFPEVDKKIWKEVNRETHPLDEKHAYAYSFVDYER